ncbi:MAG: 5-oxoprolinase subunit PxpB [Flavisolibacter sp.]
MSLFHPYTIFPLGDSALLIDFGNTIDETINNKVYTLYSHLKNKSFPFIKDLVPAFSSLAVYYDVISLQAFYKGSTAFESLAQIIEKLTLQTIYPSSTEQRNIKVPVCYSLNFGLDLRELEEIYQVSAKELIELHAAKTYRVYMLGFLPGFPYMGEIDQRIAFPRKITPRLNVPSGSVGIAGNQTGIYPFDSPGGWQIIGRTPLSLFNKNTRSQPALFQAGDQVNFYSISEDEFEHFKSRHS